MDFVYVIAFDPEGRFLMVRHHSRSWEMPGGRIEEGETPEDAAHREFLEETGLGVTLFDETIPEGGGLVFGGTVGKKKGERRQEEILDVGMFRELPEELSFPRVEYETLIAFFSDLLHEV